MLAYLNFALLWALMGVLCLITWAILSELRGLKEGASYPKVVPLSIGTAVPRIKWIDVWTGISITDVMLRGQPSMLVFLSSSCPLCADLPHSLLELSKLPQFTRTIFVCNGSESDCAFRCQALQKQAALVMDPEMGIAKQFGVSTYPTVVFLDDAASIYAYSHLTHPRDLVKILGDMRIFQNRGVA